VLHRIKFFFLFIAAAGSVSWVSTAYSQDLNPDVNSSPTVSPVLTFYSKHISPVDGDRCPMVPSCSSYANHAFEKHGPLMGWVMTCDRIIRCGRDEISTSKKRIGNNKIRCFDPVEANDFWWFNKRIDQ